MEKQRSKKFFLFLSIIFIAFIISVSLILSTNIICKSKITAQNTTQNISNAEKDYMYLIREYEGKIGVFTQNSNTPIKIIETNPTLLPEYDQKMLEEGIYLYNETELRQLIEDFDG